MTSVALVVLDTLRKRSFDRHFEWLPGVRFDAAWATSGWTVPVHGSLFTGRYPRETGVYAKVEHLDVPGQVLAERLSSAGYTTRAFSTNAYVSEPFDFDRGFDVFETNWRGQRRNDDRFDWGEFISETQGDGLSRFPRAVYECIRSDADTLASLRLGAKMKIRDAGIGALGGDDDGAREALSFVRSTDFGDDEFCFLNLMEAHSPYNPPESYQTVGPADSPGIHATIGEGPEDAEPIERAYEDCVRYLADVYRDIFEELTDSFDYVITLGDHGESFGTNGVWSHNYGIDPELVHVPLSVYRGTTDRDTVETPVSLLDVHRTILELADLEPAEGRGLNLLAEPDPRPLLVERFGLTSSHVDNLRAAGTSDDRLAEWDRDLRGVVFEDGSYAWDSHLGVSESGSPPGDDAYGEALADFADRLEARAVDEETKGDVDEEVQDRLEHLGYA